MRALLLAALLVASGNAAAQQLLEWAPAEVAAIALHGPWPPPPVHDPSNRVSGNPAAITLGRHLFEESRLSPSGQVSCADCHQAGKQWSDGRARGFGLAELDRRTPSLWNAGYQHWFAWDGAADSLWMQGLRAVLDPREMGGNAAGVGKLVRERPDLACAWRGSFGAPPGIDDERLLVDAAKAIAAFVETLVSPRTPFDDFRDALVAGDRLAAARYPVAAQRGLRLFVGRGNCAACHFGPRFSNGEFGDTGISFFVGSAVDPGRHGGIAALQASRFNLLGLYNDDPTGASATRTRHVERQHRNFGEFKVPALRQAGRAGPYMHNGSLPTLEEVVKHYAEVSPDRLHSDGVPLVRALKLTDDESADLVSFLRTLSADAPPLPSPAPLCP